MTTENNSSARTIAHQVLCDYRRTGRFVTDLLDSAFEKFDSPPEHRSLATELAQGVTRMRLVLEHVVAAYSKKRAKHAQHALSEALHLAVYQLMYMDHIPASAAINESVKLVRQRVGEHAVRFSNGILRNIDRSVRHVEGGDNGASRVRVTKGWLEFDRALFPDPDKDPVGYLSRSQGHPEWLVKRWVNHFGLDGCEQICRANNERPSTCIRWRGLDAPPSDLTPVAGYAGMYCLTDGGRISGIPGYEDGHFIVQGLPSYQVVMLLQIESGMHILDICSAPGGKALHAADLAGSGTVTAVDKSLSRTEKLKDNQRRLRITNIQPVVGDALELDSILQGEFPRILLDAPCSNTGELCRRPEIRHRVSLEDVKALSELQYRLLTEASGHLIRGGKLVYSTCSLEEEENSGVIQRFLNERPEFVLEEEEWFLPHLNFSAGGYAARLILR